MRIIERLDLGEYVTFKPNKDVPRHRWFYFKEGFSRDLVIYLLNRFKVGGDEWVLDPFMGVGTTPLTCREIGVNTIGVEISPLFKLISQAKIEDYDVEEVKRYYMDIREHRERVDLSSVHPLLKRAFTKNNLIDIFRVRAAVEKIPKEKYRNLFYVAILSAANKSSLLIKDGSKLKPRRDKHIPPFREMFNRTVKMFIKDIKETELKNVSYHLYQGDARSLSMIDDESIDVIITSPPYLNKIEYTVVYEIEYLLLYGDKSVNPIRSYIGITYSRSDVLKLNRIGGEKLPPAALAYFKDMYSSLEEMHRVLRRGGRIALVVGQGIFPDRVVESDRILARMARDIGFKIGDIWIVNKRIAVRDRTVKIGVAEESILFLYK